MANDPEGGPRPTVGIVVVNFHGDERTLSCLDALARSTWPAELLRVAVVDNGSGPSFERDVAERPGVTYVRPGGNVGFPAGCNAGIEALMPSCEVIGLLNNDAVPSPGWIEPLVAELLRDDRVGGVNPRILLDGEFVRLRIRSSTRRAGGGDVRDLGVQLSGVRIDGHDLTSDVRLGVGFWGWETGAPAGRFAWTTDEATALVPVAPGGSDGGRVEVRLSSVLGAVQATVDAGQGDVTVDVDGTPEWTVVGSRAPRLRLVNSTGIELRGDGSCGDRDEFEPEDRVGDTPRETFGCSGAAVLFRREFLRDVGPMDDAFFLYYEDVDLCWRGRLRGWRFRYVPDAEVRHEHSATVGSNSPLAQHLAARNRLLTLTKVAPGPIATAAVRDAAIDLARATVHDIGRRALRRQRPDLSHVTTMSRVLAGYARRSPSALAERRRLERARTVDRTEAMRVGAG